MTKHESVTIIGGGLSGLTAASYLADMGADVTILEQGRTYAERNAENGDDVLIGLGGAGTISGGKLCFPPASGGIWRKTSADRNDFPAFCRHSFSSVHTLPALPRTDGLRCSHEIIHKTYRTEIVLKDTMHTFIRALLRDIRRKGVHIRCSCRVHGLRRLHDGYELSFRNEAGQPERRYSHYVLLATGRTSTPFLTRIFGVSSRHQPDLGIRLSMDAKQPAFSAIGEDVKLKRRINDHLIRTFCVCCGGGSIRTSTRGYIHYDGHFGEQITNITNLGILARSPRYAGSDAADHYLSAMQKYADADITLKDFMRHHDLLAKNTIYDRLFEALAAFASELYQAGFIVQQPDEIQVLMPAADNLNPLLYTNAAFESVLPHVYVIGDAAGVSRGFVQAMWAGRCAAKGISEEILCTKQPAAV